MYDCNHHATLRSDPGFDEDKMGTMNVISGTVIINKDPITKLIGISIDGGPPHCPCIYITQVKDNGPTALDGTLESGDEILAVNNECVSGRHKLQVAQMVRSSVDKVIFKYNKLHANPSQGRTLDIELKKIKHAVVECMSSSTADYLGVSRAIIVNDRLVKRLRQLDDLEKSYRCMFHHTQRVLSAYYALAQCLKEFGDSFAEIGVREPQPRASESLMRFAEYHRLMERQSIALIELLRPISRSFGTYLKKAIPDTKQTIRKYANAKVEYLSYCLKVKELDVITSSPTSCPLYRIESDNYDYRVVLRYKEIARKRFSAIREDVWAKIELLESKHVHDLVAQLQEIASHMASYNHKISSMILGEDNDVTEPPLFPIEMDLKCTAFQYNSVQPVSEELD